MTTDDFAQTEDFHGWNRCCRIQPRSRTDRYPSHRKYGGTHLRHETPPRECPQPATHLERVELAHQPVTWRSPWMGNRTTFVVKYLNDHYRIHLPRAIARGIVVEYLYLVADHFRIDRYRAQRFLTDEALRASALDILGSPRPNVRAWTDTNEDDVVETHAPGNSRD